MEGSKLKITNAKYLQIQLFPKSRTLSTSGEQDISTSEAILPEARVCIYKSWNGNDNIILKLGQAHFRKILSIYSGKIHNNFPSTYFEQYLGKDIKFERVFFEDTENPCFSLYFENYAVTLAHASWMKICDCAHELYDKISQYNALVEKADLCGSIIQNFLEENYLRIFQKMENITGAKLLEKERKEIYDLCVAYPNLFLNEPK